MGNEQKLKIVKWTAGLDHSVVGRAKQLYPAFGDEEEGRSRRKDASRESTGIHSGGRRMTTISDRDLIVQGFRILVDAFGDVDAERFITLTIREPQDYTEWRKKNMYVGESVHQVAERARASGARLREQYGVPV